MNRVGVVLDLLDAVPASYSKGDLAIVDSLGVAVEAGTSGPYTHPTMLDVFVGLTDGSAKQIGTINPRKFSYKTLAYAAAVGKTYRVGYTGSTGNIVILDPTIASNVSKFGTLTLTYNNLTGSTIPMWGDAFSQDVQIVAGDTTSSILDKLHNAAEAICAKINAKYGAGTVTFTHDIVSGSKYLQFVFAAGMLFSVTIDGIFDGTPVTVTAGGAGPFVSGLTGAEVREIETEAAILDGYNPTQQAKYASFNLENYIGAELAHNYDAIEVTTTLPKEYESPDAPSGWDVSFTLYFENGTPGVKNTLTLEVEALLAEIWANHNGINAAAGDALFLTKTEADALYAAK